jgi:hypothetical protein
MNHQTTSEPNAVQTPDRPGGHRRPLRFIVSLSLAVAAAFAVWAVVLAYATTNDFPQCSDQNNNGTQCKWVNGMMSNSYWLEGEAVPQRDYVAGLSASATTVHSFTWSVSWSRSSHHGFDWLTSYAQAQQLHQDYAGTPLDLNLCTNSSGAIETGCSALRTSGYSTTVIIPDDTYVSGVYQVYSDTLSRLQAFEAKYGNRTLTLWTDQPLMGTAVLTFYHSLDDSGFTPITDGGDNISGQTLIRYTLYFTSTANAMMVEYATHFAISGNPYVDPMAWGYDPINTGYGAGGLYPQGAWHVKDFTIDGGAGNIGSQDNQAKVANPTLYPIISNATWNSTAHQAIDVITMTSASNAAITGTIEFSVCADLTVPYTDTLQNGCVTGTTPITPVGSISVTYTANKSKANATSPVFIPTVSGRYCFLTKFIPSNPVAGTAFSYPPTEDTNGTTECFMAFGPTAITLSSFKAETDSHSAVVVSGLALALVLLLSSAGLVMRQRSKRQF